MSVASRRTVTARFVLSGLVQGQGVRPNVARIATRLGLRGSVRNTVGGVEILAAGALRQVDEFEHELRNSFGSELVRELPESTTECTSDSFSILESDNRGSLHTDIPVDLATCSQCLGEFDTPGDLRYRYPFISCTACGPRYSIINRMPFDRNDTTMDDFPLCKRCEAEYTDIHDRRFHAQTIACANCGPKVWATDKAGKIIGENVLAMDEVAQQIRQGKIAAILGLGGYQLICDATNDAVVSELRRRKMRPAKPLPMMLENIDCVRRMTAISSTEASVLTSPCNPIVIVRCENRDGFASGLTPGLNSIGVMLPTTPIHSYMLQRTERPWVVTSGNVHGTPLTYRPDTAQAELASVADVFLHHNRRIVRPVDDSVVQCVGTRSMTLRAGRGLAPMSFSFSAASRGNSTRGIAVGGHQKVALALRVGFPQSTESKPGEKHVAQDVHAVLAPHIGDMELEASRVRFERTVNELSELYDVKPSQIAHDGHHDYFTTHWARQQAVGCSVVQHHHAHVAASMLEHGLLDQTVLGVAFDGTGLGDDETLWGGEFLIVSRDRYRRAGYLRPFRLPGGELAVRQPWRTALSILSQLQNQVMLADWLHQLPRSISEQDWLASVDRGPRTSSMGRLFDALASIVLGIQQVSFEGEAAMRLEAACDIGESMAYRIPMNDGDPWQMDWRPMLKQVMEDRNTMDAGRIAMRFHRAVANVVVEAARRQGNHPCLLSGGVFQNRTLLELIAVESEASGLDIRMPGRIPVNDGGLALGQLIARGSLAPRSKPCV